MTWLYVQATTTCITLSDTSSYVRRPVIAMSQLLGTAIMLGARSQQIHHHAAALRRNAYGRTRGDIQSSRPSEQTRICRYWRWASCMCQDEPYVIAIECTVKTSTAGTGQHSMHSVAGHAQKTHYVIVKFLCSQIPSTQLAPRSWPCHALSASASRTRQQYLTLLSL